MKQLPTLLSCPGLFCACVCVLMWLTSRLTRGVGTLGVAPAEFGSPDPRDLEVALTVVMGAGGTQPPAWDPPRPVSYTHLTLPTNREV